MPAVRELPAITSPSVAARRGDRFIARAALTSALAVLSLGGCARRPAERSTADVTLWSHKPAGVVADGLVRVASTVRPFSQGLLLQGSSAVVEITDVSGREVQLDLALRTGAGDTLVAVRRTYELHPGELQSIYFLLGGPDPRTQGHCAGEVEAVRARDGRTLWLGHGSSPRSAVC